MYLFVGLGNIGEKYKETPHNAGFLFLDKLYDYLGYDSHFVVDNWQVDQSFEAEIATVRANGERKALLVKPTTFMNGSGRTVAKLVKKFDANTQKELVLIHDDLDVPLGKYKIQLATGPKGHKGVGSVEMLVGSKDFLRVRLGVENRVGDDKKIPGEDYVLMKMDDNYKNLLAETLDDAVKSLRNILAF